MADAVETGDALAGGGVAPAAGAPMQERLDAALLAAHAAQDGRRLVGLYETAAAQAAAEDRTEAAAFYLTHAYVFALETGDPRADRLHAALVAMGRDE